uniref:BACK domain-containing protein n=1 Tax=Parascaris equorum TaxID=6256 RepID=A0A914R8L1_PAREQ
LRLITEFRSSSKLCNEIFHFQVFEYLLYVINEAVNSEKNLDFFRLEVENLCEILNADMLNIKTESILTLGDTQLIAHIGGKCDAFMTCFFHRCS